MKWSKASAVCLQSDCGRYVVSKYGMGDGVWRYQAIRLGTPSVVLLVADTSDECKAACEADA